MKLPISQEITFCTRNMSLSRRKCAHGSEYRDYWKSPKDSDKGVDLLYELPRDDSTVYISQTLSSTGSSQPEKWRWNEGVPKTPTYKAHHRPTDVPVRTEKSIFINIGFIHSLLYQW